MALVAQGRSVEGLQRAAQDVEGSGTIQITLDTKIEIPWSPDLRLGWAVKSGIWSLERTVKMIPGVHLDRKISWVDNGEQGTLTIEARNNPAPFILAPIVAALLPWLVGLGIVLILAVIGWKIFQAAARSVEGVAGKAGVLLMVVGIAAVVMIASGKGKLPGVG
jgi:hypothetical protein